MQSSSDSHRFFITVALCCAIALCVVACPVFAQEAPRYEIQCTLDVATHSVRAHQRVVFTNTVETELSELFFHIYPNRAYTKQEQEFIIRYAGYFKANIFPEGIEDSKFTVEKIAHNEQALDYEITSDDKTILHVILPRTLSPGESIAVEIDFSFRIPHSYGRFGWHENIIALARWYPVLSVVDEQGWHNYPFYPYHQPFFTEAAHYAVSLTVPEDYVVAHTGIVKEEQASGDGVKTLFIETEFPVRDFSLAASPDYQVHTLADDTTTIKSYYLPGDDFYAHKAAEFAAGLMDNYGAQFGSYPYSEFTIVPVYLGYGGNQSSNIILMDTRAYQLPRFLIRYFDFLISHETGHQWFFNLVGSDEYKEMWIDEGINSYFISQYLDEKYGDNAEVLVLPDGFKHLIPNFSFNSGRIMRYFFIAKSGMDRPILGELSSFKEPSSIFSLAYGKGSIVIGMLRALIGDDAFNRAMQQYCRDYRFKNISVADFIALCQQNSGKDLKWFFDQWLRTNKLCDYAVVAVSNAAITIKNRGEIVMPLTTEISFSDGTVTSDQWDGNGATRTIPISSRGAIERIVVDPQETMLDIDRTNNIWPRVLAVRAVPLYFAAYEVPVVLDEYAYNLIYGPEVARGGVGVRTTLQKPFDNIASLSTGYDFNGSIIKAVLGLEQRNVLNRQLAVGLELFRDEDIQGKAEDLSGGKLYVRQELWPARYGLTEINDHITLYLLRNRKFEGSLVAQREDTEDISYLRKDEAIVGAQLNLDRSGPYFNPELGYKVAAMVEQAGHFLGGKESFTRSAVDINKYHSFIPGQTLAMHLKMGWGFPSDKQLFELGGDESLRGYDRKALRGSRILLGNIEYRFPLWENINLRLFDNIINLQQIQGVAFFDVGRVWYGEFSESNFKKDVGVGLRMHVDIGSFLEKLILRLDIAQAINEPKEDAHVWFGISHTF
ncbi:M1 family aminopeptidase [Candidatus Omnitrophota bacterium]